MSSNRITSQEITLELDGNEYQFRLDFTAMADFEQATGKGVMELFGKILGSFQQGGEAGTTALFETIGGLQIKGSDLQALTWACLGGEDSTISLREAGRILHAGNLQAIITALGQAVQAALPEATTGTKLEDKQSHPPAFVEDPPGPDGSPSGASADSPSD